MSDLDTPTSALLKLKSAATASNAEKCFLLESVEGGETLGRWSLLGCGPDRVISVGDHAQHSVSVSAPGIPANYPPNLPCSLTP